MVTRLPTYSVEDASVTLAATFATDGEGVRATLVVKFPPASRIDAKRVTAIHPDLAAAHAWVKEQAKRRGIKWEPQTAVES